jgi:hypothetical protein
MGIARYGSPHHLKYESFQLQFLWGLGMSVLVDLVNEMPSCWWKMRQGRDFESFCVEVFWTGYEQTALNLNLSSR